MKGILIYVHNICNLRVLLNNMSWTFIRVNKYRSTSFVMVTYYSIVSMYHHLFNHFNGYLGCFQFGAVMNSSMIYSLDINLFLFYDCFLKVGFLDHIAITFYIFLFRECLLENFYLFTVPSAVLESAIIPSSCPAQAYMVT